MVLRALHLCSGYGGFELALRGVARTVAHVERDAYAASVLVARMEETRLDHAPIWSDLTTFDGRPWRRRVDLITAGFPCQPFSAAGKRGGVDDDRWLWPDIERIIRDVEPRYVFLENVGQLVPHGLPEVLHSLASLGFNAEWSLLAASAVGAPHRRERIWIVARRMVDTESGATARIAGSLRTADDRQHHGEAVDEVGHPAETGTRYAGEDVGHAGRTGRSEVTRGAHGDEGPNGPQHSHVAHRAGENVADAACLDEREPHHQGCALARSDTRQDAGWLGFPPPPDDRDGWERWTAQGGPQPGLRRGVDGPTPWLADALHLGGNGLVPQCARAAWDMLTERAGWDVTA